MASNVEIGNSALHLLGEDSINAFTDDSVPAKLMNAEFGNTRDALLREHPWKFAIKRVQLGQLATGPLYGFTYAYQLPGDCLRVLDADIDEDDKPWKIEGRTLTTDATAVKIRYLAQVTDPAQFDGSFMGCLAARLAMELAVPITNSLGLFDRMTDLYQRRLQDARNHNAIETSLETYETPSPDLLKVREA